MRISFIWYWNRAEEIYPNWRDGLRAALEVIEQKHEVKWILGEKTPTTTSDFILFWGDSDCPLFSVIDNYKAKKGIILTTNPRNIDNLRKLDVIYCESDPVYEEVRRYGLRAKKAFGTDTSFYNPNVSALRDLEYFYPATFSPWKRQDTIAHLGKDLVCVGTVQPDGRGQIDECKRKGVRVEEGYFSPNVLYKYYNRARHVPIPAIHGSERTCLEAMSMNILPTVNPKNLRTISYVDEYMTSEYYSPREFVLANYSEEIYAKQILEAIE